MQINLTPDNKFKIQFQYNPELVSAVKSLPSRRYNPNDKSWLVPAADSLHLKTLVDRLDVAVEWSSKALEVLEGTVAAAQQSITESRAATIEADIPRPDGFEYLPYQRAGISYALQRPSTLIADEMGLGKTIQAIGFANAAESKTVLIVCPASLRLNWLREWQKWDTLNREAAVVSNGKQALSATPVIIINYDVLHKFDLPAVDLLILDEVHYCKNPKAKRTKVVFGYWDKERKEKIPGIQASRRLLLTGTPILNKPIELYPLLEEIAPEQFGSWKGFAIQYCAGRKTKYGWDVSGASNLPELQERLRASCMVRRLKADVLKELPAKRRQLIELDGAASAVKKEAKAWSAYQDKIDTLTAAAELAKCGSDDEYRRAVEELNEASSAAFTEMANLRHETALAKVPYAIDFINDALESVQKIVVFAHHRDVIDKLQQAFPGSVSITGETSLEDRQAAVDTFQTDTSCRVFIGNIKAAGVGLTLTAASHVVFVELDWVPGNVTQAEDRCHRIGQTDSVLVQHLVLPESLDATIAKRLIKKQEVADKALDVESERDNAIIPVRKFSETSRDDLSEKAAQVTDEQAQKALEGIKIIAGYCDGAQELDGMGFSKIDTYIGHSLARCGTLSKKQAVIALKLCTKYKRQLPKDFLKVQ